MNYLKKNIKSITFDDYKFVIRYSNKEDEDEEFICSNRNYVLFDQIVEKIDSLTPKLASEIKLDEKIFKENELIIYLKDNKITEERTENKLIEVPVKKVLSLQKNSDIFFRYTDKDSYGKRYIEISSKSDQLILKQLFATI